ncbi:hypothetical protein ACFFRR_006290 [Megaselia abdita]
MCNDDDTKNTIITAYKEFVNSLFCKTCCKPCKTPEEQKSDFYTAMTKTYDLMGLTEDQIIEELIASTLRLYTNLADLCSVDCASVSSTREELLQKMGDLLAKLGCQPTTELNEAALDAFQVVVDSSSCDLICSRV